MTSLVNRTKNNTVKWCMDVSYHRKHAQKISGSGWMAYCSKMDTGMTGNVYEMSEDQALTGENSWAFV